MWNFDDQGEEYKLFWPDQPEFVRMAARFEATIVPFGVIGEDDLAEVLFVILSANKFCLSMMSITSLAFFLRLTFKIDLVHLLNFGL